MTMLASKCDDSTPWLLGKGQRTGSKLGQPATIPPSPHDWSRLWAADCFGPSSMLARGTLAAARRAVQGSAQRVRSRPAACDPVAASRTLVAVAPLQTRAHGPRSRRRPAASHTVCRGVERGAARVACDAKLLALVQNQYCSDLPFACSYFTTLHCPYNTRC